MTWTRDVLDPALLVAYCFAVGLAVVLAVTVLRRLVRRG